MPTSLSGVPTTITMTAKPTLYEQLFGKPVEFYIIDKTTLKLKIAKPSPETLLRGREKVLKAIEVYKTFFSEDSSEDITQYIEREEF